MPAVWLQDQESGVNAGVTAAKEVKVKDAALGEIDDVAETDPEQDATSIALLKGLLTKLADPATQTTLAAVLATLTDGSLKATINGSLPAFAVTPNVAVASSFDTLRPMLGATKTASGVASEVFAGTSRKANRRGLAIKNEHPYLRIRLDGPSVTDTTGIALEPFWITIFEFDPAVDVPVYVISEAGLVKYGVVEW